VRPPLSFAVLPALEVLRMLGALRQTAADDPKNSFL
jgi:hypothetical protein